MSAALGRAKRAGLRLLWLCLAFAWACAGCSSSNEEAWATRLGAYSFSGAPEGKPSPSRNAAQRALASALAHSPMYRPVVDSEERALRLDLSISQGPSESADSSARTGPASWMVALALESPQLMRERGAPAHFEVVLIVDLRADLEPEAAGSLALESALGRGLSVLDAKSRLSLGTPEQAAKLLEMPDAELRLLALNWIGTQGQASDARAVLPLLSDRDPRVVEAALFALSRVGSPASTPALIALSLNPDGSVARQAYLALGEVGGVEALAYLRFAARNEDEPRRRRAAELALRSTRHASPRAAWGEVTSRSHRR